MSDDVKNVAEDVVKYVAVAFVAGSAFGSVFTVVMQYVVKVLS